MSKAVWVINLPDDSKTVIDSGQKVSAGDPLAERDDEKIKSPVKGEITDLNNEKIKLEFKAKKITGRGLNKKHGWGKINFQPEISYSLLNCDYQDQIIVLKTDYLTPHLAVKAKTLGVGGLIVYGGQVGKKDWPLPVLEVDKKELKLIKKEEGVKCLLDASNDCLLVPEKS